MRATGEVVKTDAIYIPSADDLVYDILKKEIVHGLAPGTPLRLRDLSERFALSTMPIREALDRLAADGLCILEPRKMARVAPLNSKDFEDIQSIRIVLECEGVRHGISRLSDEQVSFITSKWAGYRKRFESGESDSIDEYMEVTSAIYETIYHAAQRPRLYSLIFSYRDYSERYLRFVFSHANELDSDIPRLEALVNACQKKDVEAGVEAMYSLTSWTLDKVRELLQDNNNTKASKPTK